MKFLHSGGGLVIIHFANGAFHFSLPGALPSDWPEWRTKICRRVWDHSDRPGHRQNEKRARRLRAISRRDRLAESSGDQGAQRLCHHRRIVFQSARRRTDRHPGDRTFQADRQGRADRLRLSLRRRPSLSNFSRTRRGALRRLAWPSWSVGAALWTAGADPGKAEPVDPPVDGNAPAGPGEAFGKALDALLGSVEVKADRAYQQAAAQRGTVGSARLPRRIQRTDRPKRQRVGRALGTVHPARQWTTDGLSSRLCSGSCSLRQHDHRWPLALSGHDV